MGMVTADDGTPLPSIRVTASSSSSQTYPFRRLLTTGTTQVRAISASTGSFVLPNLPPGTYTLCAQGSTTYLDPCNWSQEPPEVTVAANETVSAVKLKMSKGVLLQVHLNDPKNLLNAASTSASPQYFLAGVATPAGHFYPLLMSTQDGTGRTQKLLVPTFQNLELRITSKTLALTDSAQKPISSPSYSLPMHINNTAPAVLTFNITGIQSK